jgi:hypothetical protein
MDKLFSNEGRAATQSRRYALQYVQDLDIPRLFEPPADDFSCLGPKISVLAAGTVSRLREIHGANLPYLMGIAVRESWFACSAGSWHSTLTGDPEGAEQTGQAEKLGTPEGYAQLKGWATTLMASLFRPNRDSDGAQFLYDTPYFELPDDFDILCCMALCWLGHAADAQKAGSTVEAFDWRRLQPAFRLKIPPHRSRFSTDCPTAHSSARPNLCRALSGQTSQHHGRLARLPTGGK